MKNEVMSCADLISLTYSNIERNTLEKNNKLYNSWKKIVTSIKNYDSDSNIGQNLFEHSNVVEIKNNILLIETDHPGWIQMFQLKKKYILNGLNMYVPELKIDALAFRLKGSNVSLSNVNYDTAYKNESEKLKEKMKKDEEIINKFEKKVEKKVVENKKLPEDILEKFKKMEETAKSR